MSAPASIAAGDAPEWPGGVAVIDLGEFRPGDEPAGGRAQPRISARLFLVLVAALALVLPASAPPAGPAMPLLFTVPVTPNPQYLIDSGRLYVSSGGALAAYRLSDGRRLWRTPTGDSVDWFTASPASRALVAMSATELEGSVHVFDMDTGAPLWSRTGVSGQVASGAMSIVLYENDSTDGSPPPLETSPVDVSAVDLRTGAQLWRRTLPDRRTSLSDVPAHDGVPDRLLVAYDDKALTVELVDLASGATVRQARLTEQQPALADAAYTRTVSGLVGDRLLVSASGPGGAFEYAFDADTLGSQWGVRLPAVTQYAGDCVEVICLYGDGGTTLLDPGTGALRARGDWQYAVPLPDGRLLAQSETITVVDAGLHPVVPLGLWQVVATTPVVVLARPGAGRDASTWIGMLDPGRDAVRPIADLHLGLVDSCGSDGRYLVCRAGVPGLVVYRLP